MRRWRALPLRQRRQIWAVVLLALAIAFPFVHRNPADADAMANANPANTSLPPVVT